jgi:hypothetical protein
MALLLLQKERKLNCLGNSKDKVTRFPKEHIALDMNILESKIQAYEIYE